MTSLVSESAHGVVRAAERVLAKRYGVTVRLTDPENLGGSGQAIVLRVRVSDSPIRLSRTLVIKQMHNADGASANGIAQALGVGDGHAEGFVREAVSYQFANSLATRHRPGPELLAHDLDQRLLILSDLGDVPTFENVVTPDPSGTSTSDSTTNVLMGVAQSLGRMHAATAGRSEDFGALLRRARASMSPYVPADTMRASVNDVPQLLSEVLGVATPPHIQHKVAEFSDIMQGNSFRAFSPGELSPDNIVVSSSGIRFLDYEWGGFRDAVLDLGSILVSFPQCSYDLGLTPAQSASMVDAWRAEIATVWPQLLDDEVLDRRLLAARTVWVWLSTAWHLPEDHLRRALERDAGRPLAPRRALASRWAGLLQAADAVGDNALAEHAAAVMDALRQTDSTPAMRLP